MKKQTLFLFVATAMAFSAQAETPYSVQANMIFGSIMHTGDKDFDKFIDSPVMGAEVSVELLSTSKHPWAQWYNNASVGFAATYLNFGNNDKLGSAFAVYPYLNIPLVDTKHFILNLKPGVGLGAVTKRYSNTIAPDKKDKELTDANVAFGSVLNVYLAGMVGVEFPIAQGFSIVGSYGWNHLSNGSMVTPNGGLNMFNGQLGVKYYPQHDTYVAPEKKPQTFAQPKRWSGEIVVAGGMRELYYKDNHQYAIASLSAAAYYQPVRIFRIGLGGDVFYDGVFGAINAGTEPHTTKYGKTYITANEVKNKFRAGVSLQPEFVMGRFTAGFHIGVYLYDPIKNLEPFKDAEKAALAGQTLHRGIFYSYSDPSNHQDGWLYTRAVMRYRITDHFLASIALKTHLQKAECIEWGLGYRL